ncbi:MAG: hypothetical protein II200_03080 [Bacteroidaceae bacterium]|nr:hypothetical protein [Bacteroidaceae bacterium]
MSEGQKLRGLRKVLSYRIAKLRKSAEPKKILGTLLKEKSQNQPFFFILYKVGKIFGKLACQKMFC